MDNEIELKFEVSPQDVRKLEVARVLQGSRGRKNKRGKPSDVFTLARKVVTTPSKPTRPSSRPDHLQFAIIHHQHFCQRRSFVGVGKCNAPECISDLWRDALKKLARQLILASKRFWPKWVRNGKGSLRRRRAKE
jgi:hypothetical protein